MDNADNDKYVIVRLEEAESTNSYALKYFTSFNDKTIIYTPNQTSGRGRFSRKWIGDGSSNVYMSFILKPDDIKNYPFTNLTQYLSVVVSDYLKERFDICSSIKWPNDILVDGCKISGILAEAYTENNELKGIVLGLGLNINLKKETLDKIDQKATSVCVLKNKNYDTDLIADELTEAFFKDYDKFEKEGFSYIQNKYISKCAFLGKNIKVREADKTRQYFAESVDENGLLTVSDENNNMCKIITGDVLC